MKTTTTTFFIFLFIYCFSFAQDFLKIEDNFFFKTEFDSLGECYGRCLNQSTWDTIEEEIITSHERDKIIPTSYYQYDTIKLDFHYLFKGDPNLELIINYVDTSSQMILIKKESSRLTLPDRSNFNNDCIETVTEQYLLIPSYEKWDSIDDDIINSNNWKIKNSEDVYDTRTKRVVRTPDCSGIPRVEIIPAEYFTALKIIPKENIKNYELNNLKLLCKDFHIIKTLKTDTKEIKVIPAKTEIRKKRILVHPARIELRKINCEIINPILISKIQKQLYALGFYSGSFQGEFNDETKAAIIKYQVKNNLPIGQLYNETVKHILSQKTPFQD